MRIKDIFMEDKVEAFDIGILGWLLILDLGQLYPVE
jgi:hypothetical protein